GTQRAIRELEEQKRQLVGSRKPDRGLPIQSAATGPLASEQLKVSLAQSEAAVASLRARVGEYSARYNELKASASRMPQLEAEFVQLNRDYDVNKKNYESLITRREAVSMSGDMQSVSGVADFRLIDPPRVSRQPVAPNRTLLFPLTLFVALAAGLLISYIGTEIRPAFYDGRSLGEATGLPVVGTVSSVLNESRKRDSRWGMYKFLGGVGALIGTYISGFLALIFLASRSI
ncbi:MAG: GNVR domain-containing protein, partial [Usitatibacteraceae bacterium]